MELATQHIRGKKPKYHFTTEIDEIIRKVYRDMTGGGQVKELAEKLCFPRWMISRRAKEIGAYEPRIKEPNWSEKEIEILERNAHYNLEVIRRKLLKEGFYRTTTGILLKRKRLKMLQNLDGQSATSLAECFGVDTHVITSWIKKGLLHARKRGTVRTERQGGDSYYIKDVWVKRFIIENIGLIDIRKVDKFWFVDILTNQTVGK